MSRNSSLIVKEIGESTSETTLLDQIKAFIDPSCNQLRHEDSSKGEKTEIIELVPRCIQVLAQNFDTRPLRPTDLPPNLLKLVLSNLPENLDVSVAAIKIQCENYWKRKCYKNVSVAQLDLSQHGMSWKRLFLEKHLQKLLEFTPDKADPGDDLTLETIRAYQENIFVLKLRKFPPRIPLDAVCENLSNLTTLDLEYGSFGGGTFDCKKTRIGVRLDYAKTLGKAIAAAKMLIHLSIQNSQLNDDDIRLLVDGMGCASAPTITHLDVSHNKITTNGMRLLAKTFIETPGSVLAFLALTDNCIHAEGGRALGRILRSNKVLITLELGLNRLEDAGGRMLLEGLQENKTLKHLSLSSNALGFESALSFDCLLKAGTTGLESVDFSSNLFSERSISMIASAVQMNRSLPSIDFRMNPGFGDGRPKRLVDATVYGNRLS